MIWNCPDQVRFIIWLVIWLYDITIVFPLGHKFRRACSIWDYGFDEENFFNLVRNWGENCVYSIGEKTTETQWENKEGKSRARLMKNLLNLMRKQEGKPIIRCFVGVEIVCREWKTPKTLARKMRRKTGCWLIDWLIEDRDERFLDQKLEHDIHV